MIWITLFHESWKRKQNLIGNEWLVRDFQDVTTERHNFRHESTIDPETHHQHKVATKNAYWTQLAVGLPISCLFIAMVIGGQVML